MHDTLPSAAHSAEWDRRALVLFPRAPLVQQRRQCASICAGPRAAAAAGARNRDEPALLRQRFLPRSSGKETAGSRSRSALSPGEHEPGTAQGTRQSPLPAPPPAASPEPPQNQARLPPALGRPPSSAVASLGSSRCLRSRAAQTLRKCRPCCARSALAAAPGVGPVLDLPNQPRERGVPAESANRSEARALITSWTPVPFPELRHFSETSPEKRFRRWAQPRHQDKEPLLP
ncbi:potassium/sodium hyperpolarization-activated cyclic nucleotide-gated channel 4-like [Oenanthe melanoleuca]|uniref:potassium/sodium hyperpolarization-activated cyclic nucleotide-gated channel 4-like n=1 Tax=Oenanthe melanoleuca TaxID=2939378 RepID=UPI0024C1EEC7|nr:potassium/sodium hyperpolarization-activated cyclic nucleotide-gated channel 4-like [Oenanthe melanoleuca]